VNVFVLMPASSVFPVVFVVQMSAAASKLSWRFLQSFLCAAGRVAFFPYLAVIQILSVHVLSFLFVFLRSDYLLYFVFVLCFSCLSYNIISIFPHPHVFSDDS